MNCNIIIEGEVKFRDGKKVSSVKYWYRTYLIYMYKLIFCGIIIKSLIIIMMIIILIDHFQENRDLKKNFVLSYQYFYFILFIFIRFCLICNSIFSLNFGASVQC